VSRHYTSSHWLKCKILEWQYDDDDDDDDDDNNNNNNIKNKNNYDSTQGSDLKLRL